MNTSSSRLLQLCLRTALVALTSAQSFALSASHARNLEKEQQEILNKQREQDIWFFPVILSNGQPEKVLMIKGVKSWEALQSSRKSVTKRDTVLSRGVTLASRQGFYPSEREAKQQLSPSSDTLWKIISCTAQFFNSEQIVRGVMVFAECNPEKIEKFLANRRKRFPKAEWAWVAWSALKKLNSNVSWQNRLALLQEIKQHQAFRVPGEAAVSGLTQRKLTLNLNPFLAELLRGSLHDDKKPCQKAGKVEVYGLH